MPSTYRRSSILHPIVSHNPFLPIHPTPPHPVTPSEIREQIDVLTVQAKQKGEPMPDEERAKDEIENAILRKKVRLLATPPSYTYCTNYTHALRMHVPTFFWMYFWMYFSSAFGRVPSYVFSLYTTPTSNTSPHIPLIIHLQVFDMLASHADITWIEAELDAPAPAQA